MKVEFKEHDTVRVQGQDQLYKVVSVNGNEVIIANHDDYYKVNASQLVLVAWQE